MDKTFSAGINTNPPQGWTLPGLIDPHVHLRDPGQTEKEDFYTGTCAALAGGYTTILDMPNNKAPITTLERLEEKISTAKKKIVCDIGFYFGSVGDNLSEFAKVMDKVLGLKIYLNETTGSLKINKNLLENIFSTWQKSKRSNGVQVNKPILIHAEGKSVEDVINIVKKIKSPTHFCHISMTSELKMISEAKQGGLPITCGVTPHHLFLTESDVKKLGPFGQMKPPLPNKKDQDFLWKNLRYIDVIESDHAPHTIKEKKIAQTRFVRSRQTGFRVPFGVPGLETTLPLLLTAVSEKKLKMDDVIRLCHKNPSKIFGIKTDSETKIEIDTHNSYFITRNSLFTKCGWSPFEGYKVKGKVRRVFIRGKKVFEDDKILAKPGFGKVIFPHRQ